MFEALADRLLSFFLAVAIFFPGAAIVALLLTVSKQFDVPWLWDWSPILGGVLGGLLSYPLHQGIAAAFFRPGPPLFAEWRVVITGFSIAGVGIMALIAGESTGYLEPPEALAPVAKRFHGQQYREDLCSKCSTADLEPVGVPNGDGSLGKMCPECGHMKPASD